MVLPHSEGLIRKADQPGEEMANTLVIGLGNPILGDDGVGFKVAESVRAAVDRDQVDVKEAAVGGIRFLDLIVGYEKVVIVDAIQTGQSEIGSIHKLSVDSELATKNSGCAHDVGFFEAIQMGRGLGLSMPESITVYAVEIGESVDFTETCSPAVMEAASKVSSMICKEELRVA